MIGQARSIQLHPNPIGERSGVVVFCRICDHPFHTSVIRDVCPACATVAVGGRGDGEASGA